ncbi:RidA family protein [Pseudonocardia sp. TRM90224]|uniref:RidA family protein n=1 Tax=Pseudonocardia sp. TRM90224 TaxID=2812678 RepID=UPI001E5B2FA0|nr:RidA family protein [Pseudonocardia sp. TRM90224]
MIRRWSPDAVAPPLGTYNHLAAAPADHKILFVAGQVGMAPDGTLGADATDQTRLALANIERLLAAAGGGPGQLVKLFTMVAGVEHLDGVRVGLREAFDRWFPDGDVPTHSLVVVTALARPELAVEVEAVAAVPDGQG